MSLLSLSLGILLFSPGGNSGQNGINLGKKAFSASNKLANSPNAQQGKQDAQKSGKQSKLKNFAGGVKKARQVGKDYKEKANGIKKARDYANKKMKKAAVTAAKQGARSAAKALAAETFGLSVVVVEAAIHWKWVVYAVAGIVLFLILILKGDGINSAAIQYSASQSQNKNPKNDLTVTKSCNPATLKKIGDTSTCTIKVSYAGSADDVTVEVDIVSIAGDNYVRGSSSPNALYDSSTGTLLWDAKNLKLQLNPVNFSVSFKIRSTTNKTNWNIYNHVIASGVNLKSSTGGGGVPPNVNTCKGKYTSDIKNNFLLPANFGDPQCDMLNNNDFATYLKIKDPAHGAKWFIVAQCESGYDPNAWNNPNNVNSRGQQTPDAAGAWGLFQDGSSAIMTPSTLYTNGITKRIPATVTKANIKQKPGLPMPTWGHGGAYDRGDVNWQIQVQNAIKLLPLRGWGYWGCA